MLLMNSRGQKDKLCSPTTAGWCVRLLVAAFVGFHLNYVPVHLATATHLNDLFATGAHIVQEDHGHTDARHDTNGHVPHPSSDHELSITVQAHSPLACADVFRELTDTSVFVFEPESQPPLPIFERIRAPGESPPGPLQPRAPPLA